MNPTCLLSTVQTAAGVMMWGKISRQTLKFKQSLIGINILYCSQNYAYWTLSQVHSAFATTVTCCFTHSQPLHALIFPQSSIYYIYASSGRITFMHLQHFCYCNPLTHDVILSLKPTLHYIQSLFPLPRR